MTRAGASHLSADARHAGVVSERNVLGDELQECGDPMTGFFRDGCCSTGAQDLGSHTICAVMTAEFLEHQRSIGNDLSTPMPQFRFPGLVPGDRWCVTAPNWARAQRRRRGSGGPGVDQRGGAGGGAVRRAEAARRGRAGRR